MRFIYGLIREGARAKEYETAIMWLSDCGIVHKVDRVNAAGIPLKAYEDMRAFKLFVVDVGLLSCMTGLHQSTLIDGKALFVEFKGALTEQYVCQQLKTIEDLGVYYYTNDRGSCEVEKYEKETAQLRPRRLLKSNRNITKLPYISFTPFSCIFMARTLLDRPNRLIKPSAS